MVVVGEQQTRLAVALPRNCFHHLFIAVEVVFYGHAVTVMEGRVVQATPHFLEPLWDKNEKGRRIIKKEQLQVLVTYSRTGYL